jgi:dienelactone hydrolase
MRNRRDTGLLVTIAISVSMGGSLPTFAAGELEKCHWHGESTPEVVQFDPLEHQSGDGKLSGALLQPDGAGPFPAIVLAHRVFGVEPPDCYAAEQRRYQRWGYVSLLVDSNSLPRSARSGNPSTLTGYNQADQAADILAGVQFLSAKPFVDKSRVFLVGHAFGGSALLRLFSADERFSPLQTMWNMAQPRPAGIVTLHPGCPSRVSGDKTPTLILIGSRDAMNSPRACEALGGQLPAESRIQIRIVADAGHNFDVTWFTEYDSVATEHAYELVREFLE